MGKPGRYFERSSRTKSDHFSCSVAHESDFSLSEGESVTAENDLKRAQLKDPVEFSSSASAKANVTDAGGEVDIFKYMNMPVEQYTSDVLAGGQIRRMGDNLFLLEVPKISLFSIWLKPSMTVIVEPSADNCVKLIATNCTIDGSPLIESFNINRVFTVKMVTQLQYFLEESSDLAARSEYFRADADLTVHCEVLAPFRLIPRNVIASTCTSVVSAVLASMLKLFINKLALDYKRWSSDAAYREQRRQQGSANST
eukprot:CAMPEP_0118934180 /NCGR_PEP_ID=MMETSP1169-20130426/13679_1 /TAXON_ID=36882 /ORGANISM="Pyramimonas obovata, Strain CCMP722" /LENGTH=254 /DNA_ID=CAMNT_0006877053 /DNA_START=359 /DNA_END=1123 /DNA_ORIENTATION=+